MTDAIQALSGSPVAARLLSKRGAAAPAKGGSGAEPKLALPHVETSQPVEPVVSVLPSTQLTITRDEVANTFVYRSIKPGTGEVVWQYPIEQVLQMAHRLRELENLTEHKIDTRV